MASVFTIQPNPHWVIIDNFSKLPNGAAIYTYSSLNPSVFKPAFQDEGGTLAYGQPIVGFGNGTMPPIFWEFNDTAPDDLYYIRVYDSDDPQTQNFLWDFDGLSGATSGGGGVVTTNNDIQNLITNGEFYRNAGTISPVPVFSVVAPSNNAGIVGNLADPNGPAAPDIIFAKNNNSATDTISFPNVPDTNPPGIASLAPNPTPAQYFNYTCSGAGAAETYKYLQLPIGQGLQNFSGQTVSIKIFIRLNSGSTNVSLTLRQFFGNGGSPTADFPTQVSGGPIGGLNNTWKGFIFNGVVVPSIATKTLGSCGNDALFLQVNLPLSPSLINIDISLPQVYLINALSPTAIDFKTNDQIDAIISSPRTGDIRTSLNAFYPFGWVLMNDGTIGSASSNATARADKDTFPLFDLIWRTFQTSPALAPIYTSAGVASTYGADSFTDFNANKQLSLTRNLGRVMAGALPLQVTQPFTTPVANTLTVASTASFITGAPVTVSSSTVPALVNGTTYYAIVLTTTTMSLATTPANAIAGTPITFGIGAGTGNVIIAAHALGSFLGEEKHTLLNTELPAGPFAVQLDTTAFTLTPGGTPVDGVGPAGSGNQSSSNLRVTGGGNAFNIMQPTVFMNVFIKL